MPYVLGVDGGNTKTIALVAALDGTIVGAGRGGCGDIYSALPTLQWSDSASAAIANIEYAVTAALTAARIKAADLVTAVFNMAGADWPEDFALLRAALEARGFGRTIIVQNDALGVLHAGSANDIGVSVVCGTGAATGARGPDGRIWHSSTWQDQVQGGSQLGQKALNAIYRSELGIDPPTTLTRRILDFLQLETVEAVLHMFTGQMHRQVEISVSRLTPLLLDEAHAGDASARRIVQEHGHALGDYALAGARIVGLEGTPFTLVLAGGVLRHPSPILAEAIIERVRSTSPDVQPMRCRFEPIVGVLFSALEAAGSAIDAELMARLIPTIPAPTLFETVLDSSRG